MLEVLEMLVITLIPIAFWFALIYLIVKHVKGKGARGEAHVAKFLATLPEKEYKVINNLLLPTSFGTTQIDHVIVSIYGIFVIETKNYKGVIYGGEDAEHWTQNVWGRKYSMPNPIRQNKLHISAVIKVLNNLHIYSRVYSILAFSPRATLRAHSTENYDIVYYEQVLPVIMRYNTQQLSYEQVSAIADKLQFENLSENKELQQTHIYQIKARQFVNKQKVASGICPRCGGNLVLRQGKYGLLYGCSNYPKCKYISK